MDSIHARIRRLREAKGVTAAEMGKALGVSRQTVEQWETEPGSAQRSTAPSRKRHSAVADYLGVSVQELLTGTPEDPITSPRARLMAKLFIWLTPEEQQKLIDDAQASAAHNQMVAKQLRPEVTQPRSRRRTRA